MHSAMLEETANEKKLRLFIAIEAPESIKEEVEKAQSELCAIVPKEAFRWTRKAQFHLTLRFLGSVEATLVGPLADALRAACRNFPSLALSAKNLGAFPDIRSPRILWVGMESEKGELLNLQKAVEQACAAFTKEKPEERYHPHLTLGRAATRRVHAGSQG